MLLKIPDIVPMNVASAKANMIKFILACFSFADSYGYSLVHLEIKKIKKYTSGVLTEKRKQICNNRDAVLAVHPSWLADGYNLDW